MEEEQIFSERGDFSRVREAVARIRQEVGKVIVGQEGMIDLIIIGLLADGHLLIEGNPGLAKTLTAKVMARTIDSRFSRIQFTPDLMPSDVTGTSIYNFKTSEFEFKQGPIFSNIVLIDEINRAPAKTQAALFEVMEERQITVDGQRYEMDLPFLILATQNPIEMEGTYRLPEAQMDRFFFKITIGYPSLEEEIAILKSGRSIGKHDLSAINPVLTRDELKAYRLQLNEIIVEDKLYRYIAEIVQRTRNFPDIAIGASPRASVALHHGSKALALIRGRDFITPEDIIDLCKPVLRHRIIISPEREMEGVSVDRIIDNLINAIEVPR